MKKRNYLILASVLVPILFSPTVAAQASLQPVSSGLQSQTGQAQTTNTSLNQTGGVQTNTGNQAVLNQVGLTPLGVVSSPASSSPEVVAQPSSNLRTEASKPVAEDGPNLLVRGVALIAIVGTVIGFIYLWRVPRKMHTPEQADEEKTIITPQEAAETLKELNKPPKPKKDKRSRKQRRKKS